ncbi:MAG: YbaB/EbfC family nucleoid-associated protein, partial [bacterium]|nr:YbaB/EbfC family nucleoid-associated protein [bacterium]
MKQAQKMQEDLKKVQEESQNITAEASVGGGMVKAQVNGKNELVSLTLSPEVVNKSDIEMLQDLVVAAVNEALNKVKTETADAMKKVTGGLSIPGL